MSTFQFAIASIVDANTGNGLVHTGARQDYGALEKRGRCIRSRSVLDFLQAIKIGVANRIATFRERASLRREVNQLLSLNKHLLNDIGLQRGDLHAVQAGLMTFGELQEKRRSSSPQVSIEAPRSAKTGVLDKELDATNEQFYESRQCA